MFSFCKNNYRTLVLALAVLAAFVVGCSSTDNKEIPQRAYSSLYDSLYNEVVYMDSLMEAGDLVLLEIRLMQLVAGEEEWGKTMDAQENAWVSFWVAYFYNRLGNLPEAKRYSDYALAGLDSVRDTGMIVAVINNTAGIEAELGNFDRSVALLMRGMAFFQNDTSNVELVDFYNNIGHNYNITGDYDLAKQYFDKHRALAEQLGIEEELGVYHFNVGDMYHNMGRYQESLDHMKQAMHYFHKFGRAADELHVNTMLASNYIALGRLDDAEKRLEGNLREAEHLRLWEVFVETAISLFDFQLARGNESAAFAAIEQGLSRIRINNTARMQLKIYNRLVDHYEKKGDFQRAFDYLARQDAVQDNVFNADKRDFMREMAIKYETERKTDQISQLQVENQEKRRHNMVYLMGLVLLTLIIFLIIALFRRISIQKKVLEEVNATKDRLFSIIAHDLRSPMIALQGMGNLIDFHLKNGNREKLAQLGNKTGETLSRINHLLDNLLNWAVTNSDRISYSPTQLDVIRLLKDALAVHKAAAEAKDIQLVAEVDTVNVWVDLNMAATVLRNLISNAIKYSPAGSTVSVGGAFDPDYYVVSIRDEGGGIPQHVIDALRQTDDALVAGGDRQSFGLGLRLAMHFSEKNYGRLTLRNERKGALAEIYFPLAMHA